jgi:hypothetical protein
MSPQRKKLAAYKNWIHWLLTLLLEENAKDKELNTIINIALNNGYRKEDITQIYNKLKHKISNPNNKVEKEQKWVTYTYTETYIQKITKLFKNTNIKIAFKTTHTIGKLIHEKRKINPYKKKWDIQNNMPKLPKDIHRPKR